MNQTNQILNHAKTLRLNRPLITQALKEANKEQLDFLAKIFHAETQQRKQNARRRLLSAAHLPAMKTFNDYNWSNITFPNGFNADELTSLSFIHNAEDLVLYGDVGCGKTHLATAIIHAACNQGIPARFTTAATLVTNLRKAAHENRLEKELATLRKLKILAIDELGYLPIDPQGAHLLFQVINDAYEHHSLILTTNVEFARWGTIFSDDTIAAAILDRLIHHGRILRFSGKSWRLTHALMT